MRTSQRRLGQVATILLGAAPAISAPQVPLDPADPDDPNAEQASVEEAAPPSLSSQRAVGDLDGDYERSISLEEALGLGLTDNLGLERAEVEAEVARFEALSTWGAFDWVFDANGQFADSDSVGSSSLFGGDVVSRQDSRLNLDLSRPLGTGGSFGFHFDSGLNVTDNSFANAPELYSSNLAVSYV